VKAANAQLVRAALLAAGFPEASPVNEGFSVSEGPVYVAIVVHDRVGRADVRACDMADALADAGYSSLYEGGVTVLVVKRVVEMRTVVVKPEVQP
jgi:hypothetical protein